MLARLRPLGGGSSFDLLPHRGCHAKDDLFRASFVFRCEQSRAFSNNAAGKKSPGIPVEAELGSSVAPRSLNI
jgi:hypothetical protein